MSEESSTCIAPLNENLHSLDESERNFTEPAAQSVSDPLAVRLPQVGEELKKWPVHFGNFATALKMIPTTRPTIAPTGTVRINGWG
jgi:hypothetical protein